VDGSKRQQLGKLPTGIPGLDRILSGGIPELSVSIVAGPAGSGKSILTQQIVYTNASSTQKALYLTTLSEPALKMFHYLQKFTFCDADKVGSSVIYLDIGESMLERGPEETIATIFKYVEEHKPAIVTVDSFKAIHDMTKDKVEVRKFGFDLSVRLAAWGVTAFFIGEYTQAEIEQEPIFSIADSVLRLHYHPQGLHYQRYVDVLKMRGEDYFTGLHPFTISNAGLTIYPRIKTPEVFPDYEPMLERLPTGLAELDAMLYGGLPQGTATMVAGGAGTGKTLLGLHFVTAGISRGEPSVIVTFQENPVQLRQIAQTFGWDLGAMAAQGLLVHLYNSPVEMQPDVHADIVKTAVRKVGARRVLIDPISDIEMATPDKVRYKDYIYSLVNEFKMQGITMLLTNEIPELFGPFQLSEHGVSFITDNVILLRYVELYGRMGRALNVMKVRGSQHSTEIREFEITQDGLRIGDPVRVLTGVLAGTPVIQEERVLRSLPPRSRYIVETLAQAGLDTLQALQGKTGLNRTALQEELATLQQQGLVIVVRRDPEVYYRTTVR
jgi:circadian clock protein KaiC